MEKIIEWLKANKILAIGAAALLFLAPKLFKTRRRTRRRRVTPVSAPRRRRARATVARRRKTTGRSGKKVKKAWQVKGSIAARRHMARLRKMRG